MMPIFNRLQSIIVIIVKVNKKHDFTDIIIVF